MAFLIKHDTNSYIINMFYQVKIGLICFFLTTGYFGYSQGLFKTTTAEVEFFSSAPVEDIQAITNEGIGVLKPVTGEVSFLVQIKSLSFPKALMQEHFNENYMESDRYPTATFKGKIVGGVDLSSRGIRPVVLSGILNIHGVSKNREIPASVNITDNQIILNTNFDVACEDYNIRIPKILWKNIAEVVQVRVNANLKP